jgi:HK97 family phage prohead protease
VTLTQARAQMSGAEINDLPDSAFAYIEPGGTKDGEGKTTPRSLRHFPVHDEAHARNALARLDSSPFGDKARPKVIVACKKFGIDVSEDKAAARAALELRKRRRGSMVRQLERRRMPFARGQIELRAKPDGTGGTTYEFEGYGAVFDTPFDMWDPWGDPYVEVVRPGAFSQTLAQPGLDVPFLVGHNDAGIPLARTRSGTMTLGQDDHGLHVLARMDGRSSQARDLAVAVERGDLDEMSIGFVTMAGGQSWSPDWEQRDMLNLDLHRGDVSAVALAANPATAGSSMTALPAESLSRRPGERRTPTQPYTAHAGEDNECPQCHSQNDDSASFCDQCGKSMHPRSHVSNMAGVEDMTQQCSCGKWNSEDARYCGGCGRELSAGSGGAPASYGGYYKQARAARGEIQDSSNTPDFNLPPGAPPYDPSPHGAKSLTCPHDDCPVYAGGDGDRALNAQDAKHCDQCGGPLYNADGLIVADDSGVVEEVGGDMADADLLMRTRMLELA